MTHIEHVVKPRPSPRLRALLVLGLLAGLLGMHALAPGALPMPERPVAAAMVAGHGNETASAHDECRSDPHGSCHDGGADHSEATCSSGAVGGGPALPGLTPSPECLLPRVEAVPASLYGAPEGARAPPTLAELQLLRI
ncbi:DUF6153 family protein [Streptomyces microflavus]|uniref:Uncharacterized protein n=1 Tax=Streptomyces microflavus TaxID=1919 RepID=A0A7J0CKA5_STRMI|nr:MULTISPECIES: DUF6153 family protein [Streptomyces]MDX2981839.1 DUF6153 family protein [Streptomyces sp. NRRL_B-2249]GFN02364.1 hypothetical protein Smic_09200 [Streptomyces microflavus]GGX96944.1 hypothetical protein GCM10010298_72890 [Streptomyces microflavus]